MFAGIAAAKSLLTAGFVEDKREEHGQLFYAKRFSIGDMPIFYREQARALGLPSFAEVVVEYLADEDKIQLMVPGHHCLHFSVPAGSEEGIEILAVAGVNLFESEAA